MSTWLTHDTVLLDSTCPLPLAEPFTPVLAATYGVPRNLLRGLVDRGLVRRETRGVYAVAQAPSTIQFRARALALVVAPSAVVTDRTAAWLHGIDLQRRSRASLTPPLSVFQRPGTRSYRPGVSSGERTLLDHEVTEIGGVQVTTRLRTACDVGRLLDRFDALAGLDAFLRLGLGHDRLFAELPRFRHFRGVVQLRRLVPLADARAESVPESHLRMHWYDAGLPAPEPQIWVHDDRGVPVFRLDLALPEVRYAAEYDGEEFHTDPTDAAYDAGRRDWLDRERAWHLEVFHKSDLYAPRSDPTIRLRQGLVAARLKLGRPTSYPTLQPTADPGSLPFR